MIVTYDVVDLFRNSIDWLSAGFACFILFELDVRLQHTLTESTPAYGAYSCFFVYDHLNRIVTSTDSTAFYVQLLCGDSRAVLKYALFESFVRSRSTYYGNCTAKYISTKMSIENACRDPSCRDNTSTILCCTTPYQTSMKKMSLEV